MKTPRNFKVAFLILAAGFAFCVGWLAMDSHNQTVTSNRISNDEHTQVINRATNVESWCGGINGNRDYSREYFTQTLQQSESQAKAIEAIVTGHGNSHLTLEERNFVSLYLRSILALERSAPSVLHLHPYTLKDLPCEELVRKTLESPKHVEPLTAQNHPIVYKIEHEAKMNPKQHKQIETGGD